MTEVDLASYRQTLATMLHPAKPVISSLSMVADDNKENKEFVTGVVNLIVQRAEELPAEARFPALYLMDSILKNVREPYISEFEPHIERLMSSTYTTGTQSTRNSIKKLVGTWAATSLFPSDLRAALDAQFQSAPPAPLPGPASVEVAARARLVPVSAHAHAHANQRYSQTVGYKRSPDRDPRDVLVKRPRISAYPSAHAYSARGSGYTTAGGSGPDAGYGRDYRSRSPAQDRYGHDRDRERTDSSRRPLPVLAPRIRIGSSGSVSGLDRGRSSHAYAERESRYDRYGAPVIVAPSRIRITPNANADAGMGPGSSQSLALLQQLEDMLAGRPDSRRLWPLLDDVRQALASGLSPQRALDSLYRVLGAAPAQPQVQVVPVGYGPVAATLPRQESAMDTGLLDTLSLLANSLGQGSVQPQPRGSQGSVVLHAPVQEQREISFGSEFLRSSQPWVVASLYENVGGSAEPMQCKTCGLRTPDVQAMRDHMDWHFQLNKRDVRRAKQSMSQTWFLTAEEWVVFEPGRAQETLVQPAFAFDEGVQEAAKVDTESAMMSVPAPDDDSQKNCGMCGESFKQEWDDQEEMWMLRSAIWLPPPEIEAEVNAAPEPVLPAASSAPGETGLDEARIMATHKRAVRAMQQHPTLRQYQGSILHLKCFESAATQPKSEFQTQQTVGVIEQKPSAMDVIPPLEHP